MSKHHHRLIKRYRVPPGSRIRIRDHNPSDAGGDDLLPRGSESVKARAEELLEISREELARAQELLWASDTYSVLVVVQGMDASGKDGTIKHVMSGVSPQGCDVHSFATPTESELDHTFLWRYFQHVPERGRIGLFNRSYYEDVLIVKVHPEMIAAQRLPPGSRGPRFWRDRYEDINAFERHLVRNGTVILKFFLNVSKAEQQRRLLQRIDASEKHWKFSAADLEERSYWDDYMGAYQDMLRATSTEWAPWHVIPADRKWFTRLAVAATIIAKFEEIDPQYPEVTDAHRQELQQARTILEAE